MAQLTQSVEDDIALPPQVARVLYRWSDIRDYLDANTCQRTDDPRGVPA
jgi:hypothetical protein